MFNSSFNFNGANNYIHTRSLLGEITQVIGVEVVVGLVLRVQRGRVAN